MVIGVDMDSETVLDELNEFNKRTIDISPLLEDYLSRVARTGDTMFPWPKVKPLLRKKLELVLGDFYQTCPTDNLPPLPNVDTFKYESLKSKIMEALDSFHSAPFTIQRICELLTVPRKHYKRTDKFMRGLEKNILVVSTVEPRAYVVNELNNNCASSMMNGLIPAVNDQSNKSTCSRLNFRSSSKLSNCTAQHEGFGILASQSHTTSSGSVMTHKNTIKISEALKENSDPNKSLNVSNIDINKMDVSCYKDICDSNSLDYENNQTLNDIPNVDGKIIEISSEVGEPLENFAVFATASVVEIPCISESEDDDSPDDSDSNELSTFHDNCDAHMTESAMDITATSVSEELEPYQVECENSFVSSTVSTKDETIVCEHVEVVVKETILEVVENTNDYDEATDAYVPPDSQTDVLNDVSNTLSTNECECSMNEAEIAQVETIAILQDVIVEGTVTIRTVQNSSDEDEMELECSSTSQQTENPNMTIDSEDIQKTQAEDMEHE